MHFYPGLSFDGANRLDPDDAEGLWLAITQIEAQALLLSLRVADYPTMKNEGRHKTHHLFHKLAYPRSQEVAETLTTEQLAERFKAEING